MLFSFSKVFSAREKRTKKMSNFDWPKKLSKSKKSCISTFSDLEHNRLKPYFFLNFGD